ncbi:signal peptidase I [Arthrobacter sp. PAMC25284]|uniref:signal peptidase I n=1 Tax=Arthrobacter sp. PAMC25284 TaxID=2861279 RepID=UPI001C632980|nr:signal peptidase I [Arthrobacter sp. PAMC25284]QYF91109.1 signal peptidase I [Arthrobacter sp. PAMC25284]
MDSSISFSTGPRRGARTRQPISAPQVLGRVAVGAATLLFVAVGLVVPMLHIGFSPVLTGSMRPAYAPGDLLITVPADVTSLRPGQIAVFTPPGETAPFAHRITAIDGTAAQPVLTTKGDANPATDEWRATLNQTQIPVVVATLPTVGNALLWIQNPVPRAVLTGFLGLMMTGAAVRWILRSAPRARGHRAAHS